MTSRLALVLASSLALTACDAGPLPTDKQDYAGHWRGDGMDLIIASSGKVQYKRAKGKGQVEISGPISEWHDEDFVVGVMVMKTKFDVTEPPKEVDGVWVMTVDGVLLSRD